MHPPRAHDQFILIAWSPVNCKPICPSFPFTCIFALLSAQGDSSSCRCGCLVDFIQSMVAFSFLYSGIPILLSSLQSRHLIRLPSHCDPRNSSAIIVVCFSRSWPSLGPRFGFACPGLRHLSCAQYISLSPPGGLFLSLPIRTLPLLSR